jgi:hypothetical protein
MHVSKGDNIEVAKVSNAMNDTSYNPLIYVIKHIFKFENKL